MSILLFLVLCVVLMGIAVVLQALLSVGSFILSTVFWMAVVGIVAAFVWSALKLLTEGNK